MAEPKAEKTRRRRAGAGIDGILAIYRDMDPAERYGVPFALKGFDMGERVRRATGPEPLTNAAKDGLLDLGERVATGDADVE